MSKPFKYFFSAIILVIILIVGWRYYEYVIHENFIIEVIIPCDPTMETCFLTKCDPTTEDTCEGPYKKITIKAYEAPACLQEHSCDQFSCNNTGSCSILYCSNETLTDNEICTN